MTVWLAVQAGCTTVVVPGWAAVAAVGVAAAPRLAQKLVSRRLSGSGGSGGT